MRWVVHDAIRVEGWRIAGSACAEILGYACKFMALAGLLLYVRGLQGSGTFHAFGRDWDAAGTVAAPMVAVSVGGVFLVGALLMYVSRNAAILAVEGCSRHWLGLVRSAAQRRRAGLEGAALARWATLAGQDALGAGRVVWQVTRSAASITVGAVILAGMLVIEPMLTAVVGMLAVPGLWWQYRAGLRGAQTTRDLEIAAAAMRQAWVRESAARADGLAGSADGTAAEFDRLLRVRSDQLRIQEESGLSASIAVAVLLGAAIVHFGWGGSRIAGQWDLVVAYAVALRALVGIVDGNARRLAAVHRLYPHLVRFMGAVMDGAPAGAAPPEPMPDSVDADAAPIE